MARVYTQVQGTGEFHIAYTNFSDVLVKAHLRLDDLYGKAGIVFADLWWCINTNYRRLDLYQGTTLLDSYYPSSPLTANTFYTIKMRVRSTEICGYLGNTKVLTFTLSSAPGSGAFGMKADATMTTDLLVGADSYWYYPQEAIDVTLPDGTMQTLGRIPRTGVTWNDKWEYFKLTSGEELDTRTSDSSGLSANISSTWDYLHSDVFTIADPGAQQVQVKVRDIGCWLSYLFLGDADGFSIAVFPDAETIIKIEDIAAYDYGIKGIGLWDIGMEDARLWSMLVKQV